MRRSEIINQLKPYFDIRELVCKHTYDRFGDNAWQFFRTEILHTILILRRDILKRGMVCNNWSGSGKYSQRGLRCNICQIPRERTKAGKIYLSAHCAGAGFDFTVMGMTAEQARQLIDVNSALLPYPVRMESGVSWLHIDCYDNGTGSVVSYFKG